MGKVGEIDWVWQHFDAIAGSDMHAILAVRQQVFVVEQRCAYQDADKFDSVSWHLLGRDRASTLIAYARLNYPGTRYAEPSFGRVLTVPTARSQGIGRQIVQRCIDKCRTEYPNVRIRIAAQTYLQPFYATFGFQDVGPTYDEDGIEHVDMAL